MKSQARILFVNSFILFLAGYLCFAQAPNIEWEVNLGGTEDDMGHDIRQTSDGGYIVAGSSMSSNWDVGGNNGGYDFWVVKLDDVGAIQWETNLGGSGDEYAFAVRQTSDGGYVIAGTSTSNDGDVGGNNGQEDVWVVKLDSGGSIQWEHNYGGSQEDVARSIEQTTDGGYIVAASSYSSNGDVSGNYGAADYWILKLDTSGNIDWQQNYGGSNSDYPMSIQQTNDNGYIVAGLSASDDIDVSGNYGIVSFDYWVVKLDEKGKIEWEQNYGGSSQDWAWSVRQTMDGGYIVGGETFSTDGVVGGNNGQSDFWLIRLDKNGELIWEKNYGGTLAESFFKGGEIQQTTDGGFIFTVSTRSNDVDVSFNPSPNQDSYWVVKTDSQGNIEWEKAMGGSAGDVSFAIQQTSDRGYVLTGYSNSSDGDVGGNNGNRDFWVVKLEGKHLWPRTYGGDLYMERFVSDMVVDGDGNVYTVGSMMEDDISYEDSAFLSPWRTFLMKHDKFGELIWAEYFTNIPYTAVRPSLKMINDKLIVLAIKDLYAYNLDGTPYPNSSQHHYILADNYGGGHTFSVRDNNGDIDIFVAINYGAPYSNSDYTIPSRSTGIFNFNLSASGISYFAPNYLVTYSIGNYLNVHDIVYSESQNKLYVSGRVVGSVNFPGYGTLNNTFLGAEFDPISTGGVSFSGLTTLNDPIGLLAYDNLLDRLYADRGVNGIDIFDTTFNFPLSNINTQVEGYNNFYFYQPDNALYFTGGYLGVDSSFGKIGYVPLGGPLPQLLWEEPAPDMTTFFDAIAKGTEDYVFVSGGYFVDTFLGQFPILSYPADWSLFIARTEDQGTSVEFKIGEEITGLEKKESLFMLYPNPTDNLLYVESKTAVKAASLSLMDITGNEILTAKNQGNHLSFSIDMASVESGVYFLRITTDKGKTVVHKIIKK